MSERDRMLFRLGMILDQVARPHRFDEAVPAEVHATLLQLGVRCDQLTTRKELIARLWAHKRILLTPPQPGWGGPGVTPPSAA